MTDVGVPVAVCRLVDLEFLVGALRWHLDRLQDVGRSGYTVDKIQLLVNKFQYLAHDIVPDSTDARLCRRLLALRQDLAQLNHVCVRLMEAACQRT